MSMLKSVLKTLKADIVLLAEGTKNNIITDNATVESVNVIKGTFKGLDLSHRLIAALEAWLSDNPDATAAPTTLLQINSSETPASAPITQSVDVETGTISSSATDGESA